MLASSLKSHLGQISLRLVAQLIHSRMRAIGCDINKTKKMENDLLSNFDEAKDHRTEQLSIDRHHKEVNTFRLSDFEVAIMAISYENVTCHVYGDSGSIMTSIVIPFDEINEWNQHDLVVRKTDKLMLIGLTAEDHESGGLFANIYVHIDSRFSL